MWKSWFLSSTEKSLASVVSRHRSRHGRHTTPWVCWQDIGTWKLEDHRYVPSKIASLAVKRWVKENASYQKLSNPKSDIKIYALAFTLIWDVKVVLGFKNYTCSFEIRKSHWDVYCTYQAGAAWSWTSYLCSKFIYATLLKNMLNIYALVCTLWVWLTHRLLILV